MTYKFSKFAPTAVTEWQIMRAFTKENVDMADELLLSSFNTSRSIVCCRTDHFSRRSWLEATPTEALTNAIGYATLNSSKHLANLLAMDVILYHTAFLRS